MYVMKKTDREQAALNISELSYDKDGLIATIVQEDNTGEVLMLAWMNQESLQKSINTGYTWLWSRSRQKYWQKGEESGNVQKITSISYDCDADALLIKVQQGGDGVACHTGEKSCFYREMEL